MAIATSPQDRTIRLTIDVWADVVCPWCYIGEHRLREAVRQFPHADNVELKIHTFQLDPTATKDVRPTVEYLAEKYQVSLEQARAMDRHAAAQASSDGLPYELDRPISSTFDMLRLVHLGNRHGVGWEYMWAMQRELFGGNPKAFEHDTLICLGEELGIAAEEIQEVLTTDRFADEVRRDHAIAVNLGARGVPFTVVANRVAIPGATTTEQFARVIARVWEEFRASGGQRESGGDDAHEEDRREEDGASGTDQA